jgi:hypothetical protein
MPVDDTYLLVSVSKSVKNINNGIYLVLVKDFGYKDRRPGVPGLLSDLLDDYFFNHTPE